MKIKNRFIAGAMALLIGCSTLFNAAVTVSATGTDNTSAETTVQEARLSRQAQKRNFLSLQKFWTHWMRMRS